MTARLPHVAIIGRANVGKSTLFNRITGNRTAIVNNTPGVTRDRIYGRVEGYGTPFMLIDTGGIDLDSGESLEDQVLLQGDFALAEAEAVIFLADGRQGLTPQDEQVIHKVRRSGKPLFLGVNKMDTPKQDSLEHEFARLGLDAVFPVSAEHGHGIAELMEAVTEDLPRAEIEEEEIDPDVIRVAIVGRPNVGKSSLINRLLKEERCIVSDMPGTTRDAVDTLVLKDGKSFILTDTAGIRRKGKTHQVLEKFSVIMALKALERSDIAVLLVDAAEGVTDQDATIAGYALEKGRGCIICVNKWDLAKEQEESWEAFEFQARNQLKFLEFAPIMPISAKTGHGISRILPEVSQVFEEYCRMIPTARLNECFSRAIQKNPLSSYRGKFLKLFYATQVRNRPPTFRCFVNYPEGVHFSYRRYLMNSLRKAFGLAGTPVRLIFTGRR